MPSTTVVAPHAMAGTAVFRVPKAGVILHGQQYLMNHAAREHDYDIFRENGW
jgi:hypothetical protein